jgi:hypothetical protein
VAEKSTTLATFYLTDEYRKFKQSKLPDQEDTLGKTIVADIESKSHRILVLD